MAQKATKLDYLLSKSNISIGDPPSVFHGEWLQVDMGRPTTIIAIVTQGRPPDPHTYTQYLTRFKILYGNSTAVLYPIQDPTSQNDVVSIQKITFYN